MLCPLLGVPTKNEYPAAVIVLFPADATARSLVRAVFDVHSVFARSAASIGPSFTCFFRPLRMGIASPSHIFTVRAWLFSEVISKVEECQITSVADWSL